MVFRSPIRRRKRRVFISASADVVAARCIAEPGWFQAASPAQAASPIDLFGVGLDGVKMVVVGRSPEAIMERAWMAVGNGLRSSLIADARLHPEGERFLQGELFDPDRYAVES